MERRRHAGGKGRGTEYPQQVQTPNTSTAFIYYDVSNSKENEHSKGSVIARPARRAYLPKTLTEPVTPLCRISRTRCTFPGCIARSVRSMHTVGQSRTKTAMILGGRGLART